MKELSTRFAPFILPVLSFALGVAWLACAASGASQWLYPASVTMTFLGCTSFQAALVARSQERRLGSLEAKLAALSRGAEPRGQAGDAVDNAVRANVRDVVRALRTSEPILADLARRGTVTVTGARYDLDTGRVEIEPVN